MNAFWLILAGVVGGVLGGMGFGGGTLLIPILTFLLGVRYPLASWVNLVAFLPTAIVALTTHIKNKLIDVYSLLYALFFALFGLGAGVMLSGKVPEDVLRYIFGVFMVALGSISVFFVLFGYFKRKRKN